MFASTQQFLEIKDIKEGILILKDGSLRQVLMISSLNLAVKSQEEQEAIFFQFQNFLNSLDFFCQIVVHSQRLNITGYLDRLEELEKKQPNELLKIQTRNYRKFVENLVATGAIMTKAFFLVVPFYFTELVVGAPKDNKRKISKEAMLRLKFNQAKAQLAQRVEFLILGLRRCGLNATPLNTQQLIELFWSLYHPKEAEMGYYPTIPPEILK